MKKELKKKIMLFPKKYIFLALFLGIFSLIVFFPANKTEAANFKYADFDWDEFAKENKEFWGYCDQNDQECKSTVLEAQKKFYVKLYKILAKYEAEGYFINDNIILETVFFDMNPGNFNDNGMNYRENWNTSSSAYVIDEEYAFDAEVPNEYYEQERDTLKVLIENMLAYTTTCYGVLEDPKQHTNDDGSKYYSCDNGGNLTTLNGKRRCTYKIGGNTLGFWVYHTSKLFHGQNVLSSFLGEYQEDKEYQACKDLSENFVNGTTYTYNDDRQVRVYKYWEFLHNNRYFDGKKHLQNYFEDTVLKPAGVDCMTSDLCENSLEAAGLYDVYEDKIKAVRKIIIDFIISNLESEGIYAPYTEGVDADFIETNAVQATRKSFYFPTGSSDETEENGIYYANGDPSSKNVISYYGERKNPITGEDEIHNGIDIAGVENVTSVVASYAGEVVAYVDNCQVGDYTCNDGYGNMLIIAHSNGDYTVYGHLSTISDDVSLGSSVSKGQIIGRVGKTGATKEAALHYELRAGGNDVSLAKDPLESVNLTNPRPQVASGTFLVHETALSRDEFVNKMFAYCDSSSCTSTFMNTFVRNAGTVYDAAIAANVNPELVVVRALVEGLSPGGDTNNYWGISCYNGAGKNACAKYSSLSEGIGGFANAVRNYDTVVDMMLKYAYIGKYWYNPGSWSLGGCKYFSYISQYMSQERADFVTGVCSSGSCDSSGNGNCTPTNDEDQYAYASWQVEKKMTPLRYNIFGI